MQKIAIIGYGNHVRKNILPAISRMPDIAVEAIYVRDLAKYTKQAQDDGHSIKLIEDRVDEDVEWVYISTPIATHFKLSEKYLTAGKNVICEKPLTISLEKTKKLFDLAEQNDVCLFEVCMYQFHKQYTHLKQLVDEYLSSIKILSVKFTIPHLGEGDIRYQKGLGGGALLDVGYYPISLIVSLFGEPKEIKFIQNSEDGYEVDLFGSAIFVFKNFYCYAEWGIGLPYSNQATVITEKQVYIYDRIFSKPETLKTKVYLKEGLDSCDIEIGKDDQFVNMFRSFLRGGHHDFISNKADTIKINSVISSLTSEC
jgi:predicted dehydrogenase